jgi:hypothetical protein
MALFAEALITRTPRRLWDVKTGRPAGRLDVVEAIAVCERSIALANAAGRPQHPGIVDQDIDHPETAARLVDDLIDRLVAGEVGLDRHQIGAVLPLLCRLGKFYSYKGPPSAARIRSLAALKVKGTAQLFCLLLYAI